MSLLRQLSKLPRVTTGGARKLHSSAVRQGGPKEEEFVEDEAIPFGVHPDMPGYDEYMRGDMHKWAAMMFFVVPGFTLLCTRWRDPDLVDLYTWATEELQERTAKEKIAQRAAAQEQ